ncbi:hypothetical protein BASA81_015868 [Batrachochytrium salamandrivorans]|nr:hypothetical protein BASA81_015868 [Batrachochytrium salamandrivorans]
MFGDVFRQFRLHQHQQGPFVEQFRCLSLTFHNKADKENGDKIILPSSSMEKLAGMRVQYPMQFEIRNESVDPLRRTHVGVLEFTAPEGQMFVPYWIMQNLLLEENQLVTVRNVSLELATYCKFRPQSVDFLEISDPKAVLETALRNFSCLTRDDHICLKYAGKNYFLEVCEIRPDNQDNAVSIVEADVIVDFEAPVGYVEPDYHRKSASPERLAEDQTPSVAATDKPVVDKEQTSLQELAKAREARRKQLEMEKAAYVPFSGQGRRIDDKKTDTAAVTTTSTTVTGSTGGKWKQKTQASAFHGQGKSLN